MVWSARFFFRKPHGSTIGIRTVEVLGTVFVIWQSWTVVTVFNSSGMGVAAGCVAYTASILLFWSALHSNRRVPLAFAFSGNAPAHLVTRGPYRWIRHPFYASYLLFWLAGPLGTGQAVLWIPFSVMLGVYWMAARSEENTFGAGALGQQYAEYCRRTGRFLPRVWRRGG
jgi:protein-S-isoprenylcysteine O-methyltransferase Ste14